MGVDGRVVHDQQDLGTDLDFHIHEGIEGIDHRSAHGVFDGHHSQIGMTAGNFYKY